MEKFTVIGISTEADECLDCFSIVNVELKDKDDVATARRQIEEVYPDAPFDHFLILQNGENGETPNVVTDIPAWEIEEGR